MSDIVIEKALPSDNKSICELCKIPMAGSISISMGIDPDCFVNARIQNQEIELFVCRQKNSIIGMFSVGKRSVFYNGTPKLIRYLSDLRIHPNYKSSLLLMKITRFIKTNILNNNEFVYTVVFSENNIMTNIIEKVNHAWRDNKPIIKRASLPNYSFCGSYCSFMISLKNKRKAKKSTFFIRKAKKNDINEMQIFFNQEAHKKQWYPCYDFNLLQENYYHGLSISDFYLAFENDQIVGITGIWDQREFKQTTVNSYTRSLKLVRPFINLIAKITKGFKLPETGKILNYFTIHAILIKGNNKEIFKDIIEQIYKDCYQSDFSYFLCGLDKDDSLCSIFNDFTKREVHGNIYSVSFNHSKKPLMTKNYYIEAARI